MSPKRSKGDIETGGEGHLYPMMLESPPMRWAFIRKVYAILSMQLLLTVVDAAIVVVVDPISDFMVHNRAGLGLYLFIVVLSLILMCALAAFHKRHPVNLILLGMFTLTMAFTMGLSCAFVKGKIILEAAILTSVVTIGLTLYTFWAAKRGHDFSFLGPFLFASLLVLLVFSMIQMFFPMGKLSTMIFGCLGAIIFSGFIIYDTDNMIKRYEYDDFIWAAVSLYLDILNLFIALINILTASDS
ncbi:Protein LIFEGUARD 4 [Vitis vinifera]|uniref:Protein LIFEGUARD 4 n=1 Tax=Vitis vinifera TaxID=29760 RepID=A0A438KM56_VITVI|nr:Protein LIFEGUARD 4 [Vitis vinifera]